jgi:hypothetical protein
LACFLPQFSRQSISRAVRKLAAEKRVCLLHAPRDREYWSSFNLGSSYWGVFRMIGAKAGGGEQNLRTSPLTAPRR